MTPELHQALSTIPDPYRIPLLDSFEDIERNYRLNLWRPAELDGGRFSECVISIIQCVVSGTWGAGPSKPPNMVTACSRVEAHNATHGRSLCILIPRMLPALYEVRNNRNVGHVGGDVDPSEMDSRYVAFTARWIIAELIRVFHGIPLKEAETLVHACVQFDVPEVWAVEDVKRVLKPGLTAAQQALLLTYSSNGRANAKQLIAWIEYANPSRFISQILTRLHEDRLIELNRATGDVTLSPKGVLTVQAYLGA